MINTIFKNEWVELRSIEGDNYKYIYSHEKRCNGKIVGILPFRYGEEGVEYMLRNEFTPAWSVNDNIISSITGGVENDDVINTAIHEIKEEAGYILTERDIIPLGQIRTSKSSDTIYHLFSFNATGMVEYPQNGDGSELEKLAYSFWTKDISRSEDALVYTMYYKLHSLLDI